MDNKKKLLLVDDDPDLARCLAPLLMEKGYEVQTAPNGAAGLESLRDSFPDLIVTDLNMPRFNGVKFLQSLKDLNLLKHIPVVVTSSEPELLKEGLKEEVFFRSKPYDFTELANFLSLML